MALESHASEPAGNAGPHAATADASAQFAVALNTCRRELLSTATNVEAPYASMREPIAALASTAYRGGIPPERLIAELKELLARLPHYEARNASVRGDMMRDLVTLAITSYFARKAD